MAKTFLWSGVSQGLEMHMIYLEKVRLTNGAVNWVYETEMDRCEIQPHVFIDTSPNSESCLIFSIHTERNPELLSAMILVCQTPSTAPVT